MMNYGYGYNWIFMLLVGLIVFVIVVLIIYALVRTMGGSGKFDSSSSHEDKRESSNHALEILAERYARGEINDEEYRLKKIELSKK